MYFLVLIKLSVDAGRVLVYFYLQNANKSDKYASPRATRKQNRKEKKKLTNPTHNPFSIGLFRIGHQKQRKKQYLHLYIDKCISFRNLDFSLLIEFLIKKREAKTSFLGIAAVSKLT